MLLIVIALAVVAAALVFGGAGRSARPGLALAALVAAGLLLVLGRGIDSGGDGEGTEAAEPVVFFLIPLDATTVSSPVPIRVGADNVADGHFHITVDAPCVERGQTIPTDLTHRHYAAPQAETALDLTPGIHTLCLQLGDPNHRARGGGDRVTVEVLAPA